MGITNMSNKMWIRYLTFFLIHINKIVTFLFSISFPLSSTSFHQFIQTSFTYDHDDDAGGDEEWKKFESDISRHTKCMECDNHKLL